MKYVLLAIYAAILIGLTVRFIILRPSVAPPADSVAAAGTAEALREVKRESAPIVDPLDPPQFGEILDPLEVSLDFPAEIPDSEIREIVERVVFDPDLVHSEWDHLRFSERARPFLIAALSDPRTRRMKFEANGPFADTDSPLSRILSICEQSPLASVAPYLDHDDAEFRAIAAEFVAFSGTPECIVSVRKALADPADDVRSAAVRGIYRHLWLLRSSPNSAFMDAVFPDLAMQLERQDHRICEGLAESLLTIDAQKAVPILLAPEVFTVRNRDVLRILDAMNFLGRTISHERLLPFLDEARALAGEPSHDKEYGAALIAYARNPDADVERAIRSEIDSQHASVRESAAQALCILAGIHRPTDYAYDFAHAAGFAQGPVPQRHVHAVQIYDREMRMAGHAHFFATSSAREWKTALEGLEAIGAEKRAGILRSAIETFGPNGPPEDDERRHLRPDTLSETQDAKLSRLDASYHECDENISKLLALYALANREHFRSRK